LTATTQSIGLVTMPVDGIDSSSARSSCPRRACAKCGTTDEIPEGSPLWPTTWRCSVCGSGLSVRSGFVRLAPELDDVNEGFDLTSFDRLRGIEDGHFWFTARNEMIVWLLQRFAAQAGRALEIGCGTGYVLFAFRKALPTARLAGSELHSLGLVHARQRHGQTVELAQLDARDIGLTDALDLVGAFDVLEHIADDRRVLDEFYRALRPGGVLIATVPQHPSLWSASDEVAHHQRRYKMGELASKAHQAGFMLRYESSFATLTLPLMAASRLHARLLNRGNGMKGVEVEMKISPRLNMALRLVLSGEHVLRRLGFPLPVGGSQVVVATKPNS
jgi:SAM-dependent methyltransferase